jgi:hypothetical protein
MAHPQLVDGGNDLQIWRVVAYILNKQSQMSDVGWSSSLEVYLRQIIWHYLRNGKET